MCRAKIEDKSETQAKWAVGRKKSLRREFFAAGAPPGSAYWLIFKGPGG